jgi:hypothetical protein
MRRSLVIYDFAPDPCEFPNIFSFLSVYTWNNSKRFFQLGGRLTAAAAASGGQPHMNVDEFDRTRVLEEGLEGLDGSVGAAVTVTGLVLSTQKY